MRRRTIVAGLVAAGVLGGGGLATAASGPTLGASGPTVVHGTSASARFTVGDRTIRQIRYADRKELGYRFVLHNHGPLPVTVGDVGTAGPEATLLRVDRLESAETRETRFTVPAGGETPVRLVVDMTACERVSSRAGSFLSKIRVEGEVGGMVPQDAVVELPEELHTGSPREAFCPRATSSSRSPG